MPIAEHLQPILAELKRGLEAIYGERLKAVVLFGSQARGDATPDSDVAVAVVLDDFESAPEGIRRPSELFWTLSYDHDMLLSCVPVRRDDWRRGDSMLPQSLRREGVRGCSGMSRQRVTGRLVNHGPVTPLAPASLLQTAGGEVVLGGEVAADLAGPRTSWQ